MTLPLFSGLRSVAAPPSIDLRCCDVREMLASLPDESVDLCFFDPPWEYDQAVGGNGPHVAEHYDCLPMAVILEHMALARRLMRKGGRCVLWTTHSQEPELSLNLTRNADGMPTLAGWRYVSGGVWAKVGADDEPGGRGAPGIGYHCLSSEAEPWWLLLADGPHSRANVAGCRVIPRHRGRGELHSEKPVAYQREMIRGWCPADGLVLDAYAGNGSVARSCHAEGRRYVGAEIDPDRHAMALTRLAAAISRGDL